MTHQTEDRMAFGIIVVWAIALAVQVAMAGCAVVPPGRPVRAYALISISPSIQIGGSRTEAVVDVTNDQRGDGNLIEKHNPLETRTDAGTSLEADLTP